MHLYGGLIQQVYMTEGGLRSPSQPSRFYAPVMVLPIIEGFDDEEVDALVKWHF